MAGQQQAAVLVAQLAAVLLLPVQLCRLQCTSCAAVVVVLLPVRRWCCWCCLSLRERPGVVAVLQHAVMRQLSKHMRHGTQQAPARSSLWPLSERRTAADDSCQVLVRAAAAGLACMAVLLLLVVVAVLVLLVLCRCLRGDCSCGLVAYAGAGVGGAAAGTLDGRGRWSWAASFFRHCMSRAAVAAGAAAQ